MNIRMGTLAPKHRVSSEALTGEAEVHSAESLMGCRVRETHNRVARPRFSIVNELFDIYLAYCFMKNYRRGYKIAFLPSF
jgi:hypothetical protein